MIDLLERQQLFALNRTFASFIAAMQVAQYNPALEHNRLEPGDVYVGDSDTPRYVSQEECDRWNAEAYEAYLKQRDTVEPLSLTDSYCGEVIFAPAHASGIESYAGTLAETIVALNDRLKWGSVLFLLDFAIPWLHQDNDHVPVKRALNHLKNLGVDPAFAGGFMASGTDLKSLTESLFWITRCNASLPTCYFTGIDTGFAATICAHGALHVHFYAQQTKSEIEEQLRISGMMEREHGACSSIFPDSTAIAGRQIML
jgi:hypothetical protein